MALALLGCLAGCSSSAPPAPAVGQVAHHSSSVRTVAVPATGSCPTSLSGAQDVAAQPGLPRNRLLGGATPSAGLICEYGPTAVAGQTRLLHQVRLAAAAAHRLAVAVEHLSLAPVHGAVNCPEDVGGYATVMSFAYAAGRNADLWFHTSGCRTLDNGDILASEVTHPSFYSTFEDVFGALAPPPVP